MHEAVRSPYRGWNLAERIGFRFLFLYLGLYLILRRIEADLELPMAFGLAPGAGIVMSAYAKGWAPVVVWTAKYILHLTRPIAYAPGGNSDGLMAMRNCFRLRCSQRLPGCYGHSLIEEARTIADSTSGYESACGTRLPSACSATAWSRYFQCSSSACQA